MPKSKKPKSGPAGRKPSADEGLFRATFENSLEAMVITSPDGRIHGANAEACRLLGRSEPEICRVGRAGVVDESDPKLAPALAERKRTGQCRGELVFKRGDGTRFLGEYSSAVFRDSQSEEKSIIVFRDVTERKRAEEALREERARFQHLFEHAPIAIWLEDWRALAQWMEQLRKQGVKDLRTFLEEQPERVGQALGLLRVLDVNQAALRQNGARTKAELAAKLPQLFTERTYESFVGQLAAVWQGASHYDYESVGQRLDGRRLDLIIHMDVPRKASGAELDFSSVIVTGTDMTERKRAEEALRESEARFRLTFDQSPIGAAIVSLDYRFLRVNEQLCRLTGYPAAELMALQFPDITHPADLELDMKQARQLAAGEIEQYSLEKRYVRKDGSHVWVQLSGRVLRDGQGRALHFLALVEDISERKRAEGVVGQLAAIVESSADAIIGKDLNGTILSWNRGAERLYGYTEAEAKGRSIELVVPPERQGELKPLLEQMERGERVSHFETTRLKKDGKRVEVSLALSPIRDGTGRVAGVSTIARDISERKRAEAERERLIRDLQKALAEVKTLSGLLPICAHCKKIRDDQGYWNQIEVYIRDRSEAQFSHGICPDCAKKFYPGFWTREDEEALRKKRKRKE